MKSRTDEVPPKSLTSPPFVSNDRNCQMLVTYRFAGFKEVEKVGEVAIMENDYSHLACPRMWTCG
ncbi:MAG: hypothetical protein ACJ76Y_32410 [Thermoanaerobaculia bacterium]